MYTQVDCMALVPSQRTIPKGNQSGDLPLYFELMVLDGGHITLLSTWKIKQSHFVKRRPSSFAPFPPPLLL